MIKKTIIILLLIVTIAYGYGSYFDRGDYENNRGDILLSYDEAEVVWFNLDTPFYKDATDINSISVRASESLEETYYGRWPINSGDPNTFLMTPGDIDSQWVWATTDANWIIIDDNEFTFPEKTPWNVMYVGSDGYPLTEDPNYFTYYQPERAFGVGIEYIGEGLYANNYIQVYTLLDFEPNLFNTTIGMGVDDTTIGPNNVRLGYHAGLNLSLGERNTFGGRSSGESVLLRDDNTFYGFESGKNVGGGSFTASSDYKYTFISEIDVLYGFPIDADGNISCLNNGESASDEGGGIVSLPLDDNPFEEGQEVIISGTNYYDGTWTLEAGTDDDEIRITETYNAETFNGTETVIRILDIGELCGVAGLGRMVQDSSGLVYCALGWNGDESGAVATIDENENVDFSFLNWPDTYTNTMALAITEDDSYLYVLMNDDDNVIKFDLATGDPLWEAEDPYGAGVDAWRDIDFVIDSSGNVYGSCRGTGAVDGTPIVQLDSDTGELNYIYTDTGQIDGRTIATSKYDMAIDEDLGIIISGGETRCGNGNYDQYYADGYMCNLWVRTLDNSAGDKTQVKGHYAYGGSLQATYKICTQHMAVHGGYIYVLLALDDGCEIYKYQWDGSSLNYIDMFDVCEYGTGLFFDLWGNLVVVNKRATSDNDDILYYYDTDGNELNYIDNLKTTILMNWDLPAGGCWAQGDAFFYPGINPSVESGDNNTAIGSQALRGAEYGAEPNEATAGGYKSLYSVTTPDQPTAYGAHSGENVTTASRGIYLGPYAGYRQTTLDDRFILDNRDRSSADDEITDSLFYGYIAPDPNDSWLNINVGELNLDFARLDVNDVNVANDLTVAGTSDLNDLEIDELTVEAGWSAGSVIFTDANGAISDDSEDNANFRFIDSNDFLIVDNINLKSSTATRLISANASTEVVSTDISSWIDGTTNQVTVTDDGDGTVTLSTPQDIDPNADVVFDSVKITKGTGYLLLEGEGFLLLEGTGRLVLEGSPIEGAVVYLDSDGKLSYNSKLNWDEGDSALTIDGTMNFAADAQADDDYVITLPYTPSAYTTGMMITFTANTANTGACTVNINSLGAKSLKMLHDQDPGNNYIESGSVVVAVYDGTNFQMIQPAAN